MRPRALFVIVLATSTWIAPARAEPPASPTPAPRANAQPSTGEWGWLVVGSGLLVGGALTGVGLTIDCDDEARACERAASIKIWGGIGIASLATAVGIAIVQAGRTRLQMTSSGVALAGAF